MKDKGSSKTTGLIYTSEATGYPIVTDSNVQVFYIKEQAKDMGCDIPEPLTISDLRAHSKLHPKSNVLFDNIETILEKAINLYLDANVVCATMTTPVKESPDEVDNFEIHIKNEDNEGNNDE